MRKLLLAASMLLLISTAAATTISKEKVTVDLASSEVTVEMHIAELTSSKFSYFTSYRISDFNAYSGDEKLDCEVQRTSIESQVSCDVPRHENLDIKMNYTASGLVNDEQTHNVFQYTQNFIRPTKNYTLRTILPEGSVLLDGENVSTPVVSPQNAEVGSNGRRITVEWRIDPQLGDSMAFRILYEELSPRFKYAEIGLSLVLLILLSIIGYLGYIRLSRENIENVYSELSDDEIDVVELLRENDGSILQKDLVESLDYSKAKVSGIVSELVEKEVLLKEKEGRSNNLVISKKYRG